MMRSLGRVYGTVERKEILTEDIVVCDNEGKMKQTEKEGDVLDAVYIYSIFLKSDRVDLTKEELLMSENVLKVLFIKYGEKCLDEQFLIKKLQRECPKLCITTASISSVEKYYKSYIKTGRMGMVVVEATSKKIELTSDINCIDSI